MSISADEKKLNDLTDMFTKTYTDIVEHLKSVLQKRLELELDFLELLQKQKKFLLYQMFIWTSAAIDIASLSA